jgi:dethiobiotin synthetase
LNAFFVTSSGTGVGKTFVAAALGYQLRRSGFDVRLLKPLITGFDPKRFRNSDSAILLRSFGREPDLAAIAEISPFRFRAALAPNMAAARERTRVDFSQLLAFCRTSLAHARKHKQMLLIEGVGGVMAPITDAETNIDWIAALALPVLLVEGSYLGSLSHSLTAIEVLRTSNARLRGAILVESLASPVPLKETAAFLQGRLKPLPVVAIPRVRRVRDPWRLAPDLTWLVADR